MNMMLRRNKKIATVLYFMSQLFLVPVWAQSTELPKNLNAQVPKGYEVLASEKGDINKDGLTDYVVVLHKPNEIDLAQQDKDGNAPKRPLLVYVGVANGTYKLAARNDSVVYTVNEGGQCDPFLDSGNGIAISGIYFTIENGVACGQHWTDYITFKYSDSLQTWIFHKRIFENWVLNNSKKPNADALKLQTSKVTSGKDKPPITLEQYTRE